MTTKENLYALYGIDYKGCRNCMYQIAPLRMCEWQESGGDNIVYPVCPRWVPRQGKENEEFSLL